MFILRHSNKKAIVALESRGDSLQHDIEWKPEMFGLTEEDFAKVKALKVELVNGYHRVGKFDFH